MSERQTGESLPLLGRGVLVTGGSMGIGKAVAQACVLAGADVTISARNAEALAEAEEELRAVARGDQKVISAIADVSNAAAVKALVRTAVNHMRSFTGLVNCAGVLGPAGDLDEVSAEDWVSAIQVNLVGTMLVTANALPPLRRQAYGKIVNFSGGGATSPRPRFSAYAASKAAVVRFTENLAEELNGTGLDVNAVAPGAVNTRMLQEVLDAGPEKVGQALYDQARTQEKQGGVPAERAADLCVVLLSAESDGLSGRLISAVWDPWHSLGSWKHKLAGSDVYMLRRITPEDRGLRLE